MKKFLLIIPIIFIFCGCTDYKELNNIAGFKKFNLNFGIENIFNKKYASPVVPEAINYPVSPTNPLLNPGRNFKIGFKANF